MTHPAPTSSEWPPRIVTCLGAVVLQGKQALFVRQAHEFFFKESSLYRLRFVRDAHDAVIAVEMRGRAGLPEINKKIAEPVMGASSSTHA